MENSMSVPRKRRSKPLCCEPAKEVEEGHKKARVVHQIQEAERQLELCEISKEQYHRSLWDIYHKISVHLGPKEIAALCQQLEGVGSSEELNPLIHCNRINTTATSATEISSLEAQVEELRARNSKLEKCIGDISQIAHIDPRTGKEKDSELESALQTSSALEGALGKKSDHLEVRDEMQSVNNRQCVMMEGIRMEDYKTSIGELENCVAVTSSQAPRVDSCCNDDRDGNLISVEELLQQNTELKAELIRVRSHLEMAGVQLELEIDKKNDAIAELLVLQNQKAIYDAKKAELVELLKQKQIFEAGKTELAELRSLKRTLEADRDELAALRCQKKSFEAVENELKAVYERLPHQEMLLKAAAEELQTLRGQKETLQAAIEELSNSQDLKVKHEAVTAHTAALQKKRASLEPTVTEELPALEKDFSETVVVEEMEELRKQKDMSRPEREELESLRREIAITEAGDREFVNIHGRENARTVKEQSLMAKVERLIQKQAKLMRTIAYLEEKRTEDKQERDRYCVELEAAKTKIYQTSANLNAAEQKLVSVIKENEILHEEKIHMLGEKQALQAEKDRLLEDKQSLERRLRRSNEHVIDLQGGKNPLFKEKQGLKRRLRHTDEQITILQEEKNRLLKEKQNLDRRLRHANEHIADLQFDIERVQKAKTRVELDATVLSRDLFARIESLKAELRLKQEEDDAAGANDHQMFGDPETREEFNHAYLDDDGKLWDGAPTDTKQLGDAAAANALCNICHENTRDTVILPCTHMQSCAQCVKELIQRDKSCPTCDTAISGFVSCNQAA